MRPTAPALRLSSRLLGLGKNHTGPTCSIRIETWFRRQSVARKLTTAALTSSGVTLIAACAVFATYDYLNLRARLVRDVTLLADIVGTDSTGAGELFKDASAATDTLQTMAINQHILSARLFGRDNLPRVLRPPG